MNDSDMPRQRAITGDDQLKSERIAAALEKAIATGQLRPGDRLPTVRESARHWKVSGTTIAAAYGLLQRRGLVRGEVGRGTFVAVPEATSAAARPPASKPAPGTAGRRAWRRRTLLQSERRLRESHPQPIDCAWGRPDARLFAMDAIRQAWGEVLAATIAEDLQYPLESEPVGVLAERLVEVLAADGISVRSGDLVVGSSAQEFLGLVLQVFMQRQGPQELLVVVEEPGYQTAMDTLERAGCRLVGAALDAEGMTPEALDTGLSLGAGMVLLTPRAQNPTGASWSPRRRRALADVLAAHPDVIVVEDDQLGGVAEARPGSLLNDERLAHRVLYIRSFSKVLAPDLRLAMAACQEPLRSQLRDAKYFTDGWTSRLTQRVAARLLASPVVHQSLAAMRTAYAERRTAAAQVLEEALSGLGAGTFPAQDGLHVWIQLPHGSDCANVLETAATRGVVAATGEAFFVHPGRSDLIRLNAGAVSVENAQAAATVIAEAALDVGGAAPPVFAT